MSSAKRSRSESPRRTAEAQQRGIQLPDGAREVDDRNVNDVVRLHEGDSFQAVYRGYREFDQRPRPGQPSRPGAKVRLHAFSATQDSRMRFGLWGTFSLDSKLESVRQGDVIFIGYEGKVPVPGTRKEMHNFVVAQVDPRRAEKTVISHLERVTRAAAADDEDEHLPF